MEVSYQGLSPVKRLLDWQLLRQMPRPKIAVSAVLARDPANPNATPAVSLSSRETDMKLLTALIGAALMGVGLAVMVAA